MLTPPRIPGGEQGLFAARRAGPSQRRSASATPPCTHIAPPSLAGHRRPWRMADGDITAIGHRPCSGPAMADATRARPLPVCSSSAIGHDDHDQLRATALRGWLMSRRAVGRSVERGSRAVWVRLRATPDPPEWTLQMDIGADPQPVAVHDGQGIVRGAMMPQVPRRDAIEALAGVQPCFMCRPDRGLRVDCEIPSRPVAWCLGAFRLPLRDDPRVRPTEHMPDAAALTSWSLGCAPGSLTLHFLLPCLLRALIDAATDLLDTLNAAAHVREHCLHATLLLHAVGERWQRAGSALGFFAAHSGLTGRPQAGRVRLSVGGVHIVRA
ncbi:DUF6233 domain-containing protein [Streptomyces sp. NPDC059122]|uniref:DUF6233 domain-containing protein n=1 Tax=Streptomyces sp. NPDC059122 TaxID=3346732 RepID=UPI0036B4BC87